MKHKEPVALLLVGALLSGVVTVGASEAGSAGDPLIALNWLKNTFIPNTVSDSNDRVDQKFNDLTQQLLSAGASGTELRVKRGDVLWMENGSSLTPLAGGLEVAVSTGTIVDVTAGKELPATSGNVATDHRYLAAEETRAAFSVTSDTAVVRLTGQYRFSPSGETDYNALADALKTMGLFQGSDVPYGSGYELEAAPTRIQGLIMFLRLLGEEKAALAYPGSGITFADVPEWALPYVAYAYDKGYTKGQEIDDKWQVVFGTQDPLAPRDYVTFLLRALGYHETADFQWLTAVADAQNLKVLTDGEAALLTDQPFLRAQVAYLSYFALSAKRADGTLLLDSLTAVGAVDGNTAKDAMNGLDSQRL